MASIKRVMKLTAWITATKLKAKKEKKRLKSNLWLISLRNKRLRWLKRE